MPEYFLEQCRDDGSFDTYYCGDSLCGGRFSLCHCSQVNVPENYLRDCIHDGSFNEYSSYACLRKNIHNLCPTGFVGTSCEIECGVTYFNQTAEHLISANIVGGIVANPNR